MSNIGIIAAAAVAFAGIAAVGQVVDGPRKTVAQCKADFAAADTALNPNNFDLRQSTYKNALQDIQVTFKACKARALGLD